MEASRNASKVASQGKLDQRGAHWAQSALNNSMLHWQLRVAFRR